MTNDFFTGNRRQLMNELKSELIILSGWAGMQWHGDTAVPFRQEANFWYLTGIEQPDWWLIIDGQKGQEWLVAPEIDEIHQIFDGSLSAREASSISGVKNVISQAEAEVLLQKLAKVHSSVHTLGKLPFERQSDFMLNPASGRMRRKLAKIFDSTKDCQDVLAKMRAIKQPEEIGVIEQAVQLSINAFEAAKSQLRKGGYEYEVEAELTYLFRKANATHAFEPIVAAGNNACTLHYIQNSSQIRSGDMVLIDAGARLGGYLADITRTFATTRVSQRQSQVHEAVQLAEAQIIKLLKPGLKIKDYIKAVDDVMEDALLATGLMKAKDDKENYRRYFPHAISHGLGVDVHEGLGGYQEFMPGMVLTVEPGIYIPEEGIGVRIEDDILITESGHRNLTEKLSTDL